MGPGSVSVQTHKDLLMSFGATVRMIPTSETNWDFGLSDEVNGFLYLPVDPGNPALGYRYRLGNNFFKDHKIESGWVNNGYIRNEDKLYFNAMPKDRKWSFYAALEFDRPIDSVSVDERGGKNSENSNFGLERLQATMALPRNMRFHAGWDVWGLDIIDAGGLVYGDDNPGFWLTGKYDLFDFNIGYFKLGENDFQNEVAMLDDAADDDRDLYAGYLDWKFIDKNKLRFLYAYDRIRNVRARDFLAALTDNALGIVGNTPETDSHHVGLLYLGKQGGLELYAEGVYQFGTAENTGFIHNDYDISAFAFGADAGYNLKNALGIDIRPHLGFSWTSGDDDPLDDELGGYNGVINAQRFSRIWGGEYTIAGDMNLVMGNMLYGYIPEMYGNGTPVFTGGLQNAAASALGSGRGDNPGLTMVSAGFRYAPFKYVIYQTNVNMFRWNEDFYVTNMVHPVNKYGQLNRTEISSGYVGTEWGNEVTIAMSQYTFVKGQVTFFYPGEKISDVTEALSGKESDDTAVRLAAELIWNF